MLVAMDKQWEDILEKARQFKKETITPQKMIEMMEELSMNTDLIPKINRMIYVLLLQYTKGDVHGKVVSNGVHESIETYRYLYEKGKNDTVTNVLRVQMKVMHPDAASSIEEVETKLNKWKEDIRYLRETGHKDMEEDQRRTILVSIMPEDVADALIKKFEDLKDYESLEKEALTIVKNDEMKKNAKRRQ